MIAATFSSLAEATLANPWPCASPEACASQEFYQIPGANPMYVPRGSVIGLSYVMKAKAAYDNVSSAVYCTIVYCSHFFTHTPPHSPFQPHGDGRHRQDDALRLGGA